MFVTYAGETLRAADWSLGGLRLEGFGGALPAPGDLVDLKLSMPFQGFDVAFAAKGQVVRNDAATGMFALRFTELGEREQELLRHFIEELVRGTMSDVADTIQRIDLPVTPVSTKPDVNPGQVVPVSRWPIKTIFYTGLYSALGLFVFSYIAMLGYTNVFRLEVDSAVISAPLVTVQAPNDGHVMWTSYKPGDAVKAGSVVLQVADNQLEREIDLADIDIREREAKVGASRHMLEDTLNPRPAIDARLTILPCLRRFITGATAWQNRNVPFRLNWISFCHSSKVSSSTEAPGLSMIVLPPTALTRMSMRP